MNTPFTEKELREHPAVRHYTLLCLASLLLLVVCLAERGPGWWGMTPALLGALALLLHWSLGPPLVLVALAGLMGASSLRYSSRFRQESPTLMDLLLCAATMFYVLGHYRLMTLVQHIFPLDSRRSRKSANPTQRRAPDLVGPTEIALLAFGVPTWTVLALLLWTWMTKRSDTPLDIPGEAWRVLRVTWLFLLLLIAAAIFASHRRMKRATPAESLLFLQDEVWRLTRREQGNLNRWLTWARLWRRKKERS